MCVPILRCKPGIVERGVEQLLAGGLASLSQGLVDLHEPGVANPDFEDPQARKVCLWPPTNFANYAAQPSIARPCEVSPLVFLGNTRAQTWSRASLR